MGDAEAKGDAREGKAVSGGEEEDEIVAQSYHNTVLYGKLQQDVCRANGREGGGCLLLGDLCTKTGRLVAEVLQEKQPDMHAPPVENPVCTAFEDYEEVFEKLPLHFTEDDVMWVASNLSGGAGALGAEAIELQNWLLCFGCALEELRFFVSSLADLMSNSSSPRSAYQALMACRIVVLEERPRVRPMGIGETLFWSPAALITILARYQKSVSPMPMGRTPGRSSSTTMQQAISA